MLQIVRCHYCGKRKEWRIPDKEPKWFKKKVKNPYIIDYKDLKKDYQERLTINVEFCSKECLKKFENKNNETKG